MDLKQLFQEWYTSQVSRWHREGTPKEVIAQESFFFGVQASQQSVSLTKSRWAQFWDKLSAAFRR